MKYISIFILLIQSVMFSCTHEEQKGIVYIDGYILYGEPDTSTEHQAVVYIEIDAGGGYGSACTGTLITPYHVLTAGHCASSPSSMQVLFGNTVNGGFWDSRNVSAVTVHPSYDESALTNDISVLTLSSSAPSSVTPIPPLPPASAITSSDVNVTPLQYVGFGVTETGSSGTKLTITRPPVAICDGSSQCSYNISGVGYVNMPPSTLGIRMDTDGGICSGDSGGPAFVTRGGSEYVAGVSSYVLLNSYDECDYFGVSTKVDKFSSFINGITGSDFEDCSNGTDDDGDGDVDCDDSDCATSSDCIIDACSMKTDISCGDTVSGTTVTGGNAYTGYPDVCTNGYSESGPENVYRVGVPSGTVVTATLNLSGSSLDLDLLLIKGSCSPTSCVDSSLNNAGVQESLTFTTDGLTSYLFVETYENPGAYTLTITCQGTSPTTEVCDNNIDDDLDGLTDCDDPNCETAMNCIAEDIEICDNGIDDDGDNAVDCDDADCFFNQVCTTRTEICDNYIDDDGDMKADCDDADCFATALCNSVKEVCGNGVDDDGNGRVDCDDVKCISSSLCAPRKEMCMDGNDNDGDGFTDCEDADCQSSVYCENVAGENCLNYIDDDGDGKVDCDDPDCASLTLCYYVDAYSMSDTTSEDTGCSCNNAGDNRQIAGNTLLMMLGVFLLLFRKLF
ncbi:MAG: trypsin-like serine protease [Deltaproteobacteria bacterium]|nr:trypsin-like serine protease [Deltaproteobacteria bacterium]